MTSRLLMTSTLALALVGCAPAHSCFVGFALFPPLPVVMCGVDLSAPEAKEEGAK